MTEQKIKDLLRNYIINIQDHGALIRSDIDKIGGPNEDDALKTLYTGLNNIADTVYLAKQIVFLERERYEEKVKKESKQRKEQE